MADIFTKAAFVAVFPHFATVDQAVLSAVQVFVTDEASKATFGVDYVKAIMLLVAHWLTLEGRKGNGQLTSERVGDLSASYQPGDIKRSIETTSYGATFLRLARRKVGGPSVVLQSYDPGLVNRLPRSI